MNISTPKPHVSAALKQLRAWVVLSAGVVLLAAVAQFFVFGFVHYTDARYTEVKSTVERPLRVVSSAPEEPPAAPDEAVGESAAPAAPAARSFERAHGVEVNRVLSRFDVILRRLADIGSTAGTLSAVALVLLTFMGVSIAGGGRVPGVERAVTAAAWSLVLALLVLPWKTWIPNVGMNGIFHGYDAMTGASQRINEGAANAGGAWQWLVIPTLAAACAGFVAVWFCRGVAAGVIVTSISELEEAAEREIAEIQKRGVGTRGPKAVGALNKALGDVEERPIRGMPTRNEIADDGESAPARRPGRQVEEPVGAGRSVADGGFKRMI